MRAARSLVVAIAAVVGLGIGAVTDSAAAHTDFLGADPRDGSSLEELPAEVRLEFSDDMDPGLSTITLRSGSGPATRLDLSSGASPAVLVATVPGSLAPADGTTTRWTVTYRVVSRDGHPVVGTTSFGVRTPEAEPTPSAEPSATPGAGTSEPSATASPSAGAAASIDDGIGTGWMVAIGAGVLVLLGLGSVAVARLTGRDTDA